jgi:hypothetical protein
MTNRRRLMAAALAVTLVSGATQPSSATSVCPPRWHWNEEMIGCSTTAPLPAPHSPGPATGAGMELR